MSLGLNVTIDKRDLAEINLFVKKFPTVVDQATKAASAKGKGLIIRSTKIGTGRTRREWKTRKIAMFSYEIFNSLKRALFLETGTGLFGPNKAKGEIRGKKISPITGKPFILRWKPIKGNKVGKDVFAVSVKGIRAHPMIKPNVKKIQKILTEEIRKRVLNAWKKLK